MIDAAALGALLAAPFVVGFATAVVRISVPYVMAALGGTVSERAGVVNIALEGFLLTAALGTALGAPYGATAAAACGLGAGLLLSLLYALLTVVFRGDQIVVGVGLFLLSDGLSRFLLKVAYDSTSNSPRLPALEGVGLSRFVLLSVLLTALVHVGLKHTVPGLRLRAVGEEPLAARRLGVSVLRVRVLAVIVSGLLTSVGGVYLVFEQRQFVALMSGGRGFLALAAMIFGGWRPLTAAAAALLFAAAEALGISLQASGLRIPNFVIQGLPYALTLAALVLRGAVGSTVWKAPAALGKPRD